MIVAKMEGANGGDALLFLLEPGNLAKLQLGQPIVKKLGDFIQAVGPDTELILAYCPDVQFVADRVKAGDDFLKALAKSMSRPEVFVRPDDAESIERFI